MPYHMLGAKSLEQRILGKYVEHVRKVHPGCELPQVYLTDGLFEDFAFMDELILWLATLIHDQKTLGREAGKVTNFVEGADERRAIPRVSPGEADRVDPVALFRWTLTPGGPDLLRELRGPEKAGLARFLAAPEQGGSAGRVITALADADHGPDAAAYAVVCAALWGHAEADHDLYRARGRAERWLGEQPPAQGDELDRLLASFARSGEAYVRDLIDRGEHRLADPVLTRAAQLVAQFGAQAAATASPLLPAGLDARFTAAGHALTGGSTDVVTDSVTALRAHALANGDGETRARIERVRMAVRLRRWLAGNPSEEIESVTDGTDRQIRELGWADRALEHLEAGGDPDAVLAAAYNRIGDQVRRARRRAFVEPVEDGGVAKWQGGEARGLSFPLTRAMRDVLLGTDPDVRLTRRATAALAEPRTDRAPHEVHPAGTLVIRDADATRWWTWAGYRANATLAASLGNLADPVQRPSDTHLRLRQDLSPADWKSARAELPSALTLPTVDPRAVRALKFSAALPTRVATATLAERLADFDGALTTAREPVRLEWGM